MRVVNSIISALMKARMPQIRQFMEDPVGVQNDLLLDLCNEARDTEWGRTYDYKSVRSIQDFKSRVPVQTYEDLKAWVDRLLNGEQNLLWPSEIKWFAKSSGTTADRSKFIPVSREALDECHYKCARDLLALHFNLRPESKIFMGKSLVLGGSQQVNALNQGSRYGDLSAVLMSNMPIWAQFYRAPDMEIALMDDWEKKIDKMAQATINLKITSLAGVPTWTLVLARRILEMTGAKDLSQVWPDLELYIHGAVSFTPYREQFHTLIPSKRMAYMETYNASEGFFAIQDGTSPDLLLMLDYGIYYEFIEPHELDSPFPRSYGLDEVEMGKNYAMVISTNAGLWRYLIGDTIQFVSLAPHRILITGRTKHFINAFGEELIIDNAERAIEKACQATGAEVGDYTAGPIYFSGKEKGGHEWIIEFVRPPADLQKFMVQLDAALKEVNTDYEAKRHKDMALLMPIVHHAPEGTFYNWLKSKGKLGGQNKVPRLSNDRKYLDQLLPLLQDANKD